MKKLTLLFMMVMLSLTVLCSNNKTPKNEEPIKSITLKSTMENVVHSEKTDGRLSIPTPEQTSQWCEPCNSEKNCKESNQKSDSIKNNFEKTPYVDGYTEGISNVDFIEYVPDLRWWLA